MPSRPRRCACELGELLVVLVEPLELKPKHQPMVIAQASLERAAQIVEPLQPVVARLHRRVGELELWRMRPRERRCAHVVSDGADDVLVHDELRRAVDLQRRLARDRHATVDDRHRGDGAGVDRGRVVDEHQLLATTDIDLGCEQRQE